MATHPATPSRGKQTLNYGSSSKDANNNAQLYNLPNVKVGASTRGKAKHELNGTFELVNKWGQLSAKSKNEKLEEQVPNKLLGKSKKQVKENILLSVSNTDENDFPSEDEVDLHDPQDGEFDDGIYDENGKELLATENNRGNTYGQRKGTPQHSQGSGGQQIADVVDRYRNLQDLQDDPVFQQIVNQAVDEKLRQERMAQMSQPGASGTGECTNTDGSGIINISNGDEIVYSIGSNGILLPQHKGRPEQIQTETPRRVITQSEVVRRDVIKSPSDTTIYAPGLMKVDRNRISGNGTQFSPKRGTEVNVNQISQFVDQMRIESDENRRKEQTPLSQAKDISGKMIIDAEKVRASIDNPTGNVNFDNNGTSFLRTPAIEMGNGVRNGEHGTETMTGYNGILGSDVNPPLAQLPPNQVGLQENVRIAGDESFFHITCHVDLNLHAKIEKGEFVELEKLLPKDITKRPTREEGRMELVQNNGATYFVPAADKGNKISNVRRWEQAFRVYAAIYTRANPHRAAEVWQYVYVINLAASSYTWENVANYDYTFRQLMAQYPERSWALIYSQMWSLTMRDPVNRFERFNTGNGQRNEGRRSSNSGRDDYCWHFNKNRCKFGQRCKFEHRCFYCDGHGHGLFNCRKKNGNTKRSSDKGAGGDNKHEKSEEK